LVRSLSNGTVDDQLQLHTRTCGHHHKKRRLSLGAMDTEIPMARKNLLMEAEEEGAVGAEIVTEPHVFPGGITGVSIIYYTCEAPLTEKQNADV